MDIESRNRVERNNSNRSTISASPKNRTLPLTLRHLCWCSQVRQLGLSKCLNKAIAQLEGSTLGQSERATGTNNRSEHRRDLRSGQTKTYSAEQKPYFSDTTPHPYKSISVSYATIIAHTKHTYATRIPICDSGRRQAEAAN